MFVFPHPSKEKYLTIETIYCIKHTNLFPLVTITAIWGQNGSKSACAAGQPYLGGTLSADM